MVSCCGQSCPRGVWASLLSLWVVRVFAPVSEGMAASNLSMGLLSLIMQHPWLLRALGHEEFGSLGEVSKTVKDMLADSFMAIFLYDQLPVLLAQSERRQRSVPESGGSCGKSSSSSTNR